MGQFSVTIYGATGSALSDIQQTQLLAPFQQTAIMVGMTYLPPFVLHSAMSRDQTRLNASAPALISHATEPRIKSRADMKHATSA